MQAIEDPHSNAVDVPARTFERITVVRDLAGRKVPVAIVHAFAPSGAELAIVERYALSPPLDAAALDAVEKDARITMSLRHPNIAQIRDVWREGGEVRVASEVVEGETLEELRTLAAGTKDLTIEVGVRIVVDILAALSALHALGSGGLAHGEVTATNAVVGFDGTTRVVRPFRGHIAGKVAEPDWLSYAAPEVIRGGAADVRADLFAVGVLLWETLSRRKLFPKATRDGRIARSMPIGKPQAPPDATWAAPLGAVAERALANDPGARYTTAAEMAAAVRLAVRSKLAMPPRVAAAVDKLANTRILERRLANALPEPTGTSKRPSLRPSIPDGAVRALSALRPSSRPPTPKPGPVAAMPPVPKAPLLPSDVVRAPRPLAPPLKLADPTPSPPPIAPFLPEPIEETPISLDAAFVEPEPAPVPTTQSADGLEASVVPGGAPPTNRRLVAILASVLLVALIGAAAVIGVMRSKASSVAVPRTDDVHANATVTAMTPQVTATATPKATTAPTETTAPTAVPDTSSSVEADPSATAAPTETSHRRTRPRPTYDPMGI